jgi:hypothetical protein
MCRDHRTVQPGDPTSTKIIQHTTYTPPLCFVLASGMMLADQANPWRIVCGSGKENLKGMAKKTQSKSSKKGRKKKNKLGVRNSLVNNINARKKKNISRSKKKSTVSKKDYNKMQDDWK